MIATTIINSISVKPRGRFRDERMGNYAPPSRRKISSGDSAERPESMPVTRTARRVQI